MKMCKFHVRGMRWDPWIFGFNLLIKSELPFKALRSLDVIHTQISTFNLMYTFFFYKQFSFDPRPENCSSFSKKLPQKIV